MILVCIEDGKGSNGLSPHPLTSERNDLIMQAPFTPYLKKFKLYECDEGYWESKSLGVIVKDNNGVKFWYSKIFFKPLNDFRNEKILNIIGD